MQHPFFSAPGKRSWRLLPVLALLAGSLATQAQSYQALPVTGYTADVVANGLNIRSASTVTAAFENPASNVSDALAGGGDGNVLMERGHSNAAGSPATVGLPPGGLINSTLTSGLPFQLASYSGNNSLRLINGGSGTLTLVQPQILKTLYVLAAAGGGNAMMGVTLQFSDGSTQFFGSNNVSDWYGGSNSAISGVGRTSLRTDNIDNDGSNPRLYQIPLSLSSTNWTKTVTSVLFANTSTGVLNIMGISAETALNLVVSTTTTIPAGTYNSITVTGTGTGTLAGDVVVNTSVTVQSGGTLNDGCFVLSGAGAFTLAAGGTLGICSPAGITPSGTTGTVQTSGTRSFSTDASYVYNGTATQVTGTGLPAMVRNLTTTNANIVTLTARSSVSQILTVGAAGSLFLNGQVLTLLATPTSTALIVNSSTGTVNGATAVIQTYLDPSLNAGPGYRHLSPPVFSATLANVTAAAFSPEVSQGSAYNASATPGTVTPFPNVFSYDQSRLASVTNNLSAFDKGFAAFTSPTSNLGAGYGYVANIAAGQVVSFTGQAITGQNPFTLTRAAASSANAADAGWWLMGNPFPAPLDYSLVAPTERTGLDAAMYVFASTGQYAGAYRSYVNGIGGNPVLAVGQAFWLRVSAGLTSGVFYVRSTQRLTTQNPTPLQRGPADVRPRVQLELRGATGPADALYAYAETGASPAFDAQFDAVKRTNSTGLNLASLAATGEALAIDGRPAFTAATVLPLTVGVPAAGTYSLTAAALSNLPAGLDAFLSDAVTGQTVNLSQQPSYAFTVSTAQATASTSGRFRLHFSLRSVLATRPVLTAAEVVLYPNPAHEGFTVLVPAVAGAPQLQAELLNALGQVVRCQTAALPADGAHLSVVTTGLAEGIYTLRLHVGSTTLAKRVVLQ